MVDRQAIMDVCNQIVRAFHPLKVVLFGSYATGQITADSDVDLLVIMPFEGSPARKAYEIDLQLRHRFPLDVLVRTPEYIEQRRAMNDFFIREIMETGQVLYDAAHAGVGSESRS